MEMETILVGVGFSLVTLGLTIAAQRQYNQRRRAELGQLEQQGQTLEKQLHQKEREYLEERNRTELDYLERLKKAKEASFEEGRQLGVAEGERKRLEEILSLKQSFSETLQQERDKAATEARDRLRAEYEIQSKLFSVQISPLVRVVEDKGLLSSTFQTEVGYQYQLLINGIPAFQPHLIIERSEVKKEVNEENVRELARAAKQIAEGAIEMYLGVNGQFAKIATPIVKRLKT